MFSCDFNAFTARSITLKFRCSECGEEIEETIESLRRKSLTTVSKSECAVVHNTIT